MSESDFNAGVLAERSRIALIIRAIAENPSAGSEVRGKMWNLLVAIEQPLTRFQTFNGLGDK